MSLAQQKETRRRWNCFSKVDQQGAFDFYTFVVSLDALSRADCEASAHASTAMSAGQALVLDQYQSLDKVRSLAVHEYTHFVDATSTLWGMRYMQLVSAGNAASYGGRPGAEQTFHRAKELFDFVRSLRWPDYYTEKYPEGDPSLRPWSAGNTGGRVFDSSGRPTDRPIVFVRFGDRTGRPIVRSPVSTVSVLEASAMAQELLSRANAVQALHADARTVEEQEMSRKTLDYIYSKDLTEYSVCAHLFANNQRCTDILVAYRCVAILTRWVLNMPVAAIPILLENMGPALQQTSGWDAKLPWMHLLRRGVECHDVGAIFYVLVYCLPPNAHVTPQQFGAGFQHALKLLGLGEQMLKAMMDAEMAQAAHALAASTIAPIRRLAAAGLRNFEAISLERPALPINRLHLPQAVLQDMSLATIFTNPGNELATYDVEAGYEDLVRGQIWIENFAEACF